MNEPWLGGSVGWSIATPKGCRFNFRSGQILRLRVPSWVGTHKEGNLSMFLSHIDVSHSLTLPPLSPFLFLQISMNIDFIPFFEKEGKRRRKRGRKTSMSCCLLHTPHWGPGLQPRHVPWLGIKLVTLWFAGWHSIHLATPPRALGEDLKKKEEWMLPPVWYHPSGIPLPSAFRFFSGPTLLTDLFPLTLLFSRSPPSSLTPPFLLT